MKSDAFDQELKMISSPDIRRFTKKALDLLPDYFYTAAASSSGKYHPSYALGDGGLVRHTKAAVRFASHLLSLEQYRMEFSSAERDCALAALLLHDGWKHGTTEHGHTVHEHPDVCARWIREEPHLDSIISQEARELVASAVASHMGEWNVSGYSPVVLEKPSTAIQKFVHMCDYLASRKDLEVQLSTETAYKESPPKPMEDYVMTFGKYRGQLLVDVFKNNRGYLEWMKENMTLREPLKSYVERLLG